MAQDIIYHPGYMAGQGSKPRLQSMHPFRQLVSSGTNINGAWTGGGGGSGHSGYGPEPLDDYDYQSDHQGYIPSGGSYSYQSAADTGYGVPPAPIHHPHPPPPPVRPSINGGAKKKPIGGGGGAKKRNSNQSIMSALTLLSFFFFVNLLQGCIKDHMDYMNPTVMVMTTDIRRKSLNKMDVMNSREQGTSTGISSAGVISTNDANIVMQPADMLASAALSSATVMESMKPYVNLQSPYSSSGVNRPVEVPQTPIHQSPPIPGIANQYPVHNTQSEVVHHQRPLYDVNQPDAYVQHLQPNYPAGNGPSNNKPTSEIPKPIVNGNTLVNGYPSVNGNPLVNQQQPPVYMGSSSAHPSNQYQEDGLSQPSHSQYSTPRNPFYDHQRPDYIASHSYKGDHGNGQYPIDNVQRPDHTTSHVYQGDHATAQYTADSTPTFPHKYLGEETESLSLSQGPVPWSSASHSTSMVSPAIMAAPIRRATIFSVSPAIKWASVPSNVDDHTYFEGADNGDSLEIRHAGRYGEISSAQRKYS